jgi:hypothetical protein
MCVSFALSTEQALDIEPETLVYGSGCSKQRIQNGSIVVDKWFGRAGNNLYQIAHAIFAAKLSGKLQVEVPLAWSLANGSVRQLFNFTGHFDIDEDEEFRARVNCEEREGSYFFIYQCSGVKRSDYTKVFRTYMLPHLIDGARGVCQREEANTKRELVIHLRAGDLMSVISKDANTRQGIMAPCSALDKILATEGPFERIRALTEPKSKHPCLEKFAANGVEVQSESLGTDSCVFMHAKHIAYFARSSFSEALSLFNPKPVTVYNPMGGPVGCRKHGPTWKECPHGPCPTECPNGQTIKYCVSQLEKKRSIRQKINWVKNCSIEDVWREGLECFA